MNEVKLPSYLKFTVILFGITLFFYGLVQAKQVLVPLLISAYLAILLTPLSEFLENKLRFPKILGAIVSVSLIGAFIFATGYFFYSQLIGLVSDLPMVERRITELFDRFKDVLPEDMTLETIDFTKESLITFLRTNSKMITTNAMAAVGNITIAFIIPVYVVLMLYFRDFLYRFMIMALKNLKTPEDFKDLMDEIRNVVRNYIVGMFLVICVLVILNSVALFSLGIKHAFLFAVFAGILNIIPYLGPLIGSTVPILFALLTKDSLWYPVGVFACFYVIQLIESNFLTPTIVGNRVSMNPLITLLALFIGAYVWGLVGMILFIPSIAVLKVIFDRIEPLKPYGFLLGDARDRNDGYIRRRLSKFKRNA